MPKHDVAVAERFLMEQLKAALDAAMLTDWRVEQEPYTGSGDKVVTFVFIGGADVDSGDSGDIVMSEPLYRILARHSGRSLDAVVPAASAFHDWIHRAIGQNADGSVYFCRRERPVRATLVKGQQTEVVLGGDYRLSVKGA